ncbi:AraC family transcriptional regulator [Desulfopila aestuarii]|uniref:AraC-type DNA-binding protein n=1 Tax=Desulfopila aestuarii DSM 18488 TaxID=1121416 RepID=A0A1M7XVS9_9BACT|nr:AraC family transcriptional regulator [Desulfopila aestuarii]SHO42800.1 AraC-type DNA-binding protein [Desulfopila aestuarii DSM 18488]
MKSDTFLIDPALPFVECRYSKSSQSLFKPHMHSTVSIGAVDQGQVQYTVGNDIATLIPGALALINPEALHSCNTLNSAERSYYMLYLDIDWCLTVQKSLWEVDHFIPFAAIRIDDSALYQQYCSTAEQLFAPDIHLQEKEQILVELASAVFLLGCSPQNATEQISGDIDLLKRMLQEDLHKDLTLNSLAASLNANPYTLLRKFKAETGITPHAYRMNCRINLARKYLSEGKDITDTALECGFFDQSHLHRHFKAMTTVTPQEYRVNFIQ